MEILNSKLIEMHVVILRNWPGLRGFRVPVLQSDDVATWNIRCCSICTTTMVAVERQQIETTKSFILAETTGWQGCSHHRSQLGTGERLGLDSTIT